MTATEMMTADISRIEKMVANLVEREVQKLEQKYDDRTNREVLASVACLFAARASVILHIWSGQAIDVIRKRIFETYDDDVKGGMKAYVRALAKQEGGG